MPKVSSGSGSPCVFTVTQSVGRSNTTVLPGPPHQGHHADQRRGPEVSASDSGSPSVFISTRMALNSHRPTYTSRPLRGNGDGSGGTVISEWTIVEDQDLLEGNLATPRGNSFYCSLVSGSSPTRHATNNAVKL
uniref:(northern house mosquito) hypothetical protein n=1 Tax=Culex pipiens TaxID=7175 RepID=A0A8D7ZYV0_CULPI